MAQLDKTFPTNDCSMCILSPKMVEVGRHPKISLFTLTEVQDITGEVGSFSVSAIQHPRYVDMEKCIACGACAEVCPRKVSSDFDEGLVESIYLLESNLNPMGNSPILRINRLSFDYCAICVQLGCDSRDCCDA